jgi:hypothetical protein
LREKLLASTLIATQQSTQHENIELIAQQIEYSKQQESVLRSVYNSTVKALQQTNQSTNLIDCIQQLNSNVRVFAPRNTIDHGWYHERVIEVTLDGMADEIFAFLNQATLYAQLTSLSWTVLENNQNQCAMIWRSYTIDGAVIGKPCSLLSATNSIFTKLVDSSNALNLNDAISETLQPDVRGIIVRNGQMAALIYYDSAYSIVFEGDVVGDYDIETILPSSIILNHPQNGKNIINI